MGLDITAYPYAALIAEHDRDETDCWGAHTYAFIDSTVFGQSIRGLVAGRCYSAWGEGYRFRAGSYHGYNEFRDALSQAALGVSPRAVWDDRYTFCERPFFELINFSDCEGTIGPEAAADLARDFQDERETVLPKWDPADERTAWFRDSYDCWQQAFELAANTGIVVFG